MTYLHSSGPNGCRKNCACCRQERMEDALKGAVVLADKREAAKPSYWELVDALEDLLSTEECVCIEAELKAGSCSVCLYNKMLSRIPHRR